jgi:hypothetical protein
MLSTITEAYPKFHRSILSRNADRQRFVTGKYPLTVPKSGKIPLASNAKWGGGRIRTRRDGTLARHRTITSVLWAFQWLDEERRRLHSVHNMVCSIELLAEIHTEKPAICTFSRQRAGSSATMFRQQQQNKFESSHSLLTASGRDGTVGDTVPHLS